MVQIHSLLLSLEDPYYLQLGAIAQQWAALEYQLQNIIWRAMGLDNKQGRVLTVGMSPDALSGVLRNLPRQWITDDNIKIELKELLNDIKDNIEWRNAFIHGIWTADANKPDDLPWLNYIKSGEERILPRAQQVTPEYLHLFAQTVDALNHRASAILEAIGGVQPPSPEIS